MFTGIIEEIGIVTELRKEQGNLHIRISSSISKELKIDQSIAHNGICLTVVAKDDESHMVTAIDETLQKTNLSDLKIKDPVNLERCMILNARLDGHLVQGHVDQVAACISKEETNGSWIFRFRYDASSGNVTVEKGSICINGISLTVFDSADNRFSVAIIPYTYKHTNMHRINIGDRVNLEFDIIGKYVSRLMDRRSS